jgi:mono/diheme cytochrome c family protein
MRSETTNIKAMFKLTIFLIFNLLLIAHNSSFSIALADDLVEGKEIYKKRCLNCHGEGGEGDGPAADLLYPRPRDFTLAQYKIRTTMSGELPTNEDLYKSISEGLHGTSMIPWKEVLSEREIQQLVTYIKTFSRWFEDQSEPPLKIEIGKRVSSSSESIEKGRELYRKLECWKCHGDEGRGDGPSSLTLKDDWNYPIYPADLTRAWNYRGGGSTEDIYRTFVTGLNGTPMPSYADVFETPEEANEMNWHLANYVSTFSPQKEKPDIKPVILSLQIEEEIPSDPADPLWDTTDPFFYPMVGQIIKEPRWFTPSVDMISIRSLRNENEIGFLLEWHDKTESTSNAEVGMGSAEEETSILEEGIPQSELPTPNSNYPDAIALQFPVNIPDGAIKPYFLMGDTRNEVHLWNWAANTGKTEEWNAKGMDKLTQQTDDKQNIQSQGIYNQGKWQLVMRRSIKTEENKKDIQFEEGRFIPIAFHVWDGSNGETESKHAVSSWYLLYLEPERPLRSNLFPPLFMIAAIGVELWFVRRIKRNGKRDI